VQHCPVVRHPTLLLLGVALEGKSVLQVDRWTVGQVDRWTVGLDCWTGGQVDCWTGGEESL